MKKDNTKFFIVAHSIIGIFFLGFVVYSCLLMQEIYMFENVAPKEYMMKNTTGLLQDCMLGIRKNCEETVLSIAKLQQSYDFKAGLIRYGIPMLFTLFLFLSFLISTVFHSKKLCINKKIDKLKKKI